MFSVKKSIKIFALLLIIIGIISLFVDALYFNENRLLIIIGIFLWSFSTLVSSPLTEAHRLAGNAPSNIVSGEKIWEPIANEASNFKSAKLVEEASGMITITATNHSFLFDAIFAVLGGIIALSSIAILLLLADFLKLFAIIPAIIAFFFLRNSVSPSTKKKVCFSKKEALFWMDDIENKMALQHQLVNGKLPFSAIYGVQLLQVHHFTSLLSPAASSRNYYSYELNLILTDGQRINVMTHGAKAEMIIEAKILARYLSKKIWHRV